MRRNQLTWVKDALAESAPELCGVLVEVLRDQDKAKLEAPPLRDSKPYQRKLLHDSSVGELVLIHWKPGGGSALHDHGGGFGWVFVLEGSITEQSWPSESNVRLGTQPQIRTFSAGQWLEVGVEHIHQMTSQLKGPTTTLHAYQNTGGPMRIPDPTVKATFLVAPSHGAWRPATSDVIEEQKWAVK